jgi:nucleotide-binding universal stress UspA family protein
MTTTFNHAILVPLDGSKFAEQALPLAASIARATQRRLRLCHVRLLPLWPEEVADPDTVEAMRRILHTEGETYLHQIQRQVAEPDLVIDTVVLPGDAVSAAEYLVRHMKEQPVDMVVMATHGRGGIKRAWSGSVADYLIRRVHVPVLLVRGSAPVGTGEQRILVAFDGSPLGERALDEACALAAALHREITLLRVVVPVLYPVPGVDVPYAGIDMELTATNRRAAEQYLATIEHKVRARGIECSGVAVLGNDAAESILTMARPPQFSMIVVTTHGDGGLKRLVLGSVADTVARGAEVPVLILRPPKAGKDRPWAETEAAAESCAQ